MSVLNVVSNAGNDFFGGESRKKIHINILTDYIWD